MSKNPRNRLQRNGKIANDVQQRTLSSYFKRSNVKVSDEVDKSPTLENPKCNVKGLSDAILSTKPSANEETIVLDEDIDEIPPTPVSENVSLEASKTASLGKYLLNKVNKSDAKVLKESHGTKRSGNGRSPKENSKKLKLSSILMNSSSVFDLSETVEAVSSDASYTKLVDDDSDFIKRRTPKKVRSPAKVRTAKQDSSPIISKFFSCSPLKCKNNTNLRSKDNDHSNTESSSTLCITDKLHTLNAKQNNITLTPKKQEQKALTRSYNLRVSPSVTEKLSNALLSPSKNISSANLLGSLISPSKQISAVSSCLISPSKQVSTVKLSDSLVSPSKQISTVKPSGFLISPSKRSSTVKLAGSFVSPNKQITTVKLSGALVSPSKQITAVKNPGDAPESSARDLNDDSLDFNFDSDSDLCITPEKSSVSCNKSKSVTVVPQTREPYFKVVNITKSIDGVHLTLLSSHDAYTRSCLLKSFWVNTNIEIGDNVNIIADFDNFGQAVIDDQKGIIVLNPDLLVSSTSIVSTLFCSRKAVLSEKFRGWDPGNEVMLLGNVIHDLFQKVSQEEPKTIKDLQKELKCILESSSYLHEMYGRGLTISAVEEKAAPYLPSICGWINQYQSINPTPLCTDSKGSKDEILAQVTEVQDIEENIWCTKYGIKGKIDLTVEVKLHKRSKKETKIAPLELKTGKCSFSDEHQGQVILYSLMMSERLVDPGGGLLLYLSEGPKMKFIEATQNTKRGLIQLRNELAFYFKYLSAKKEDKLCVLPDPISRYKFCTNCPYLLPCTLMEDVLETSLSSAERSRLVAGAIKHLSSSHKEFFSKWYLMLQLEYQCQRKKEGTVFWRQSAVTREQKGTGIANLKLNDQPVDQTGDHFSHTFYRIRSHVLTDIGITAGQYVTVSSITKPSEVAISMGTVTSVTKDTVTVLLDKNLYKRRCFCKQEEFRIDLNQSSSAFATSLRNLITLMADSDESEKLRKLVIDRVEPVFEKGLKRELADKIKLFMKTINVAQQRAVLKLLMAKDYILLQGMPGTGKTSTIVALVRVLVTLGFSVLLTSYTHSAVDNILIKLMKHNQKFIRLGQASRIHSDVIDFSSDKLTRDIKTVKELQAFYNSVPIVATTCLSLNHPVFKQRVFDYCIVDEASQILQSACFGPLFCSKRFVLVGDSKQLPPVANSKEARELGFCESLFSKLESSICTFELNIQYRMNSEIMRLCNELTYDGKLISGSDEVSAATLSVKSICHSEEWCQRVLSSDLSNSVLFLDTDLLSAAEVSESSAISNPMEVDILVYLMLELVEVGADTSNVGIISFYKKQVQLLHQKLRNLNVEVNTVDQYQGRDKSVILISCVRSSDAAVTSDIMQDDRRLNVALTRAKHKLVIVGSRKTLLHFGPFEKLLRCLRADQIVTLREDMMTCLNQSNFTLLNLSI